MTRWQRFKHSFGTCRGPVIKQEYLPPHHGGGKMWGVSEDLVREMFFGVTLFHCECSTCGKAFTNRKLGDARTDAASE